MVNTFSKQKIIDVYHLNHVKMINYPGRSYMKWTYTCVVNKVSGKLHLEPLIRKAGLLVRISSSIIDGVHMPSTCMLRV